LYELAVSPSLKPDVRMVRGGGPDELPPPPPPQDVKINDEVISAAASVKEVE
jgi:hypothetical protein